MKTIKAFIRQLFIYLHIDLTKNIQYDRLTQLIFKRVLNENSNTIDIGCHKGEILTFFINQSPKGHHFAFEPIPELYNNLKSKFSGKNVEIFPFALAESNGESTFNYVKNAQAYSGIQKRRYDISNPEIEVIKVELKRLDDVIPQNTPIHLIKIDVEGGEFGVLKGAVQLLKTHKPVILFECGIGASDYYGTKPEDVFNFLVNENGYKLNTLKLYLNNNSEINKNEFVDYFNTNKEYYFIAY